MNIRIPTRWLELHPGDMVVSRVPYHRLQKYVTAAESEGFAFRLDPHESGYLVTCERRPDCARSHEAA